MVFFNSTKTYAAETGSISIGTSPQELSGLIYIAVGRGYFVANGLNVTIKDYDSGSAAVDGMLSSTSSSTTRSKERTFPVSDISPGVRAFTLLAGPTTAYQTSLPSREKRLV